MGTRCNIRLFAVDAELAARAVLAAVKVINQLETKYSRYKPDNFMHRLNHAACHGRSMEVDDECMALLELADVCHRQSEGLFDITSGILRKAWDFESHSLPDPEVLERTLAAVGWHHVERVKRRVAFARPGMELDFGGIVKEYAADRAAGACRQSGIRHGLVDMGGDIVVIGPTPEGQPWRISIQDPRVPEHKVASFEIASGALATSGDYARCIEIEGKRYSHILSPKTGWPVQGLASVTVVSPQCVLAGCASTTAMLMEAQGVAWLQQLGLPHLWVDLAGEVGGTAPQTNQAIHWHAA